MAKKGAKASTAAAKARKTATKSIKDKKVAKATAKANSANKVADRERKDLQAQAFHNGRKDFAAQLLDVLDRVMDCILECNRGRLDYVLASLVSKSAKESPSAE